MAMELFMLLHNILPAKYVARSCHGAAYATCIVGGKNHVNNFYFFLIRSVFDQISTNFDVIRRIFDHLSWSTKRRSRRNIVSTKCRIRPNVGSSKWFSTKCHGSKIPIIIYALQYDAVWDYIFKVFLLSVMEELASISRFVVCLTGLTV